MDLLSYLASLQTSPLLLINSLPQAFLLASLLASLQMYFLRLSHKLTLLASLPDLLSKPSSQIFSLFPDMLRVKVYKMHLK